MQEPPSIRPDPSGDPLPSRRRRRAVGPPCAQPAQPLDGAAEPWRSSRDPDARPDPDDDARLLADVPPHHGS